MFDLLYSLTNKNNNKHASTIIHWAPAVRVRVCEPKDKVDGVQSSDLVEAIARGKGTRTTNNWPVR